MTDTSEPERRKALPQLKLPSDLPRHRAVLTAPNGRVRVRDVDRDYMALLELIDGRVVLLWTCAADRAEELRAVVGTAQREGLKIAEQYQITADLLRIVYDAPRERADAALGKANLQSKTADQFDEMAVEALRRGASDLHLLVNPGQKSATARFRCHGRLTHYKAMKFTDAERLSQAVYNVLTDAGSASGSFNAKDYLDGAITRVVSFQGRDVHLRIRLSSLPAGAGGWKITLRFLMLAEHAARRTLADLGYDEPQIKALTRMIQRPQGAILLCGETGAGKSTTLVACAQHYVTHHAGEVNLISIEDPIEYDMSDICVQVPVVRANAPVEGDSDFARALRQVLRSDPDAIIVGECRDTQTVRLMLQAVQSGHKCFSTLHAGSVFGAFERLDEIGIEPHRLAMDDMLAGIISQVLVPIVCPDCAWTVQTLPRGRISAELLTRVNRKAGDHLNQVRFRSDGRVNDVPCERCDGTGTIGRTVVAEVLMPDARLRQHIYAHELHLAKAYWRGNVGEGDPALQGRTMLDQAIGKMLQGLVSPTDVEAKCGVLDDQESVENARKRYEDLHGHAELRRERVRADGAR